MRAGSVPDLDVELTVVKIALHNLALDALDTASVLVSSSNVVATQSYCASICFRANLANAHTLQ
jgi:hypothetical protein